MLHKDERLAAYLVRPLVYSSGRPATLFSDTLGTENSAPFNPPATQPPPPLSKKSQRHRKRHVPSGPAGVWFQNFQQSGDGRPSTSNDDRDEEEEEEDQQDVLQNLSHSLQHRSAHPHELISFSSPAWIAMQCDLRWVTPSLPTHFQVAERYQALRPHVPEQFTMIHELIKPPKDVPNPWFCENCMVLVSNIQGSTTANGWTVSLTDETGETLTAWIQPESIRNQLQRRSSNNDSSGSSWFRTGCVWWLQGVTLFLSPQSSDTDSLSYLLLVGEDNIRHVWTPADGQALSDEAYIEWMEKRRQIAVEEGDHETEQQITPVNRRLSGSAKPRSYTSQRHDIPQSGSSASHSTSAASTQSTQRETMPRPATLPTPHTVQGLPMRPDTQRPRAPPVNPYASSTSFITPSTNSCRITATKTQQTLTSNAPSDLMTIASSPKARPKGAHESLFASYACAQTENTISQLEDSSRTKAILGYSSSPKNNQTLNLPRAVTTTTTLHQGRSHDRADEKLLSQPNPRVTDTQETPLASRKSGDTTVNTTFSRKKKGLSTKKRKRPSSKLWSGAAAKLDFSDEDDDDDEEGNDEMHVSPPVEAPPPQETTKYVNDNVKKSLFRQDKLAALAGMLSSDDESD